MTSKYYRPNHRRSEWVSHSENDCQSEVDRGREEAHVGHCGGGELVDHSWITDNDLDGAIRRGLRAVRKGKYEDEEMRRHLREESHVCVARPGDVGHPVVGMPVGEPSHGDGTIGASTRGSVGGRVGGPRGRRWGG